MSDKKEHTSDTVPPFTTDTGNADNEKTSKTPAVDRREYLKLTGTGAALLGGISLGSNTVKAATQSGPPNPENWELTFEDDFDGTSLDTSNWGVGWGWGNGSPGSKTTWARERHVNVRDSMLVLTASKEDWQSDGILYAGGINSKNKVTVEPPVYFEAKCKFIAGAGWQNAFWSKPNDESWPPEIDVVEYLQPDNTTQHFTSHNLHYSSSGVPGDSSTHQTVHGSYSGYSSESDWAGNAFHTYGLEWRKDAIRHYVDGQLVEETTDPNVLESFNNGGAEYLMLSLNLDNVGTTDKSISWANKEFLCDWVRVWNYTSDGSGDDTSDDATHYFWARSADGTSTTFTFESSGGNIRLDSSGYEANYWIADDEMSAGGTTNKTSSLPGFWFDGEITDFSYDGPLEIFIDNNAVDPDTLVEDSTSDTSVVVSTGDATNVDETSATLSGDLADLGSAESADVYFEYGPSGGSLSRTTRSQTLSSTNTFSVNVSGLKSGTEYEYRAVAEASDGDTDAGTGLTFATGDESGSSGTPPAVDKYRVAEAGSPNPHAEITASWSVSDADEDLTTVTVEVSDESGSLVDAVTTDVSGGTESGTDQFSIKHARGETFDVTLVVRDAADQTTSATWTVTE